jgi:hypothetical protein
MSKVGGGDTENIRHARSGDPESPLGSTHLYQTTGYVFASLRTVHVSEVGVVTRFLQLINANEVLVEG